MTLRQVYITVDGKQQKFGQPTDCDHELASLRKSAVSMSWVRWVEVRPVQAVR